MGNRSKRSHKQRPRGHTQQSPKRPVSPPPQPARADDRFWHTWTTREVFATVVGLIGTVLAIPSLVDLEPVATIAVCVIEVGLLVLVMLTLPTQNGRVDRRRLLVVATALLVAVAMPIAAQRVLPAPLPYERATYTPFDIWDVKSNLKVKDAEGSCWTTSQMANDRTDMYRCMTSKSLIYDPCFNVDKTVVCPGTPWSTEVTRLRPLTEPLPAHYPLDRTKFTPWAIELETGQRCIFLTGGTWAVAGKRLDYECDIDGSKVYALDLERGTAQVDRPGAAGLRSVPLVRVWS